MRKRVYVAVAAVLLVALGLAIWEGTRTREPLYQGKRLSEWMRPDVDWPSGPVENTPAPALWAAGTNAIPVLLKMLRTKESAWGRFVDLLQRKCGVRIAHIPAFQWHLRGAYGFERLRGSATNAVPSLVKLLEEETSIESRRATLLSLSYIGPEARGAGPAILKLTGSTNTELRYWAMVALSGVRPEGAFPVFATTARDPDARFRDVAARGLERLGTNAVTAVPLLTELLSDRDRLVRSQARRALLAIDPVAAAKAGVSTNHPGR